MFTSQFSAGIAQLATAFIPVLLGIILHEVAHGWAASLRGDQTARMLGRLTLNPVPHIDPMGLAMFAVTALFTPVVFGWARPVPVNVRNMRNPRWDMMLVSVAGPLTNMLLALLFAVGLGLTITFAPDDASLDGGIWAFVFRMCRVGMIANFGLAWINLLPIPPLDGSHLVEGLLPPRLGWSYSRLGRYGFVLLLALLMTGAAGRVLLPLIQMSVNAALSLIQWLFSL